MRYAKRYGDGLDGHFEAKQSMMECMPDKKKEIIETSIACLHEARIKRDVENIINNGVGWE